ncbi:MAG: acyl-protein synthetase [Acidobacteriota bacterium]|nr:acyl-protein synthetase [Acidobacteriota bacterium]
MDAQRVAATDAEARPGLRRRILALIDRLADGSRDDAARDAVLVDIARWQATRVEPYRRLLAAAAPDPAALPVAVEDPSGLPAVPTDVFRFARVAAHPPAADLRTFRTSGTTSGARGAASLSDLGLYDAAARAWAAHMLFPDDEPLTLAILAPHEDEAPDSSLAYMLARFAEWFGAGDSAWVWSGGELWIPRLEQLLNAAESSGRPLALLGTSFAFVHAEDAFAERRWRLPAGSRLMQTGGYKGRSREIEAAEMRRLLSRRYGLGEPWIVAEYGMTELSSQLYESTLRDAWLGRPVGPRRLLAPGWVRTALVHGETLAEVPEGGEGLVRIDDAANLDTAWAIQTSDRGRRVGEDGLEILGRAAGAVPRGCSLAAQEALGRSGLASAGASQEPSS